jgi:hypothetical protein
MTFGFQEQQPWDQNQGPTLQGARQSMLTGALQGMLATPTNQFTGIDEWLMAAAAGAAQSKDNYVAEALRQKLAAQEEQRRADEIAYRVAERDAKMAQESRIAAWLQENVSPEVLAKIPPGLSGEEAFRAVGEIQNQQARASHDAEKKAAIDAAYEHIFHGKIKPIDYGTYDLAVLQKWQEGQLPEKPKEPTPLSVKDAQEAALEAKRGPAMYRLLTPEEQAQTLSPEQGGTSRDYAEILKAREQRNGDKARPIDWTRYAGKEATGEPEIDKLLVKRKIDEGEPLVPPPGPPGGGILAVGHTAPPGLPPGLGLISGHDQNVVSQRVAAERKAENVSGQRVAGLRPNLPQNAKSEAAIPTGRGGTPKDATRRNPNIPDDPATRAIVEAMPGLPDSVRHDPKFQAAIKADVARLVAGGMTPEQAVSTVTIQALKHLQAKGALK